MILSEAPVVDGPVRGCGAVHGGGGVRAAVCGSAHSRGEIRLIDVYGEERVLIGPVPTPTSAGGSTTWRRWPA